MLRSTRFLATVVALLFPLATASADAGASKPAQRVADALEKRGYDEVRVRCDEQARPQRAKTVQRTQISCRYRGLERSDDGAAHRCRGRAVLGRRMLKIERPECRPLESASPLPELGFNGATEPAEIELARRVGARTSRMQLSWAQSEKTPGAFDFSAAEPVYNRLLAAGMPPVIFVAGTPAWAREPRLTCAVGIACPLPPAREYDWAWQRFIKAVIAQFPAVKGIEIWNEPNWSAVWGPQPDPERYAELVTLADVAAGQTAANPPIVFAGLYPGGGSSPQIEPVEFLRRAYAHGLSYDVLGIHSYPMRRPSFAGSAITEIEQLWKVAAGFGDEPASWLTEVGISTGGASWSAASEPEQAKALIEIYRWAQSSRRIPLVIVHKLRDGLDVDGGVWGFRLGLRNLDGTPKQAFCALATLRSLPCV